ncbi:MAG: hypothetical protein A2048_00510 [Deltaproteobacteria bacterium GWA2_45_12]|nr:MAG: hypothetical protein A2048_00510 [Deltaproteobacteria bacterium GWA2_45_12]
MGWLILVGGFSLSVLVLAGLVHFFGSSPYFALKEIELISDSEAYPKEFFQKLAQIPYGKNLFCVNLRQIRENIKRFPWVRDVQVRRKFPQGLVVHVELFEPVALLVVEDAGKEIFYYLSHEGAVFKKLGPEDATDFPRIYGFTKAGLGKFPRYYRAKVNEAFAFLKSFIADGVNAPFKLKGVVYQGIAGITAHVQHESSKIGLKIYFGPHAYPERQKAWGGLVAKMQETRNYFQEIDLNGEDKIFARLQKTEELPSDENGVENMSTTTNSR